MTPRDDRPSQDDEDAFDAWLERKHRERKSSSEAEVRQRREADFPEALQGRWIYPDDSDTDVVIQGSQILWGGVPRPYVDKIVVGIEGDEILYEVFFPDNVDEDSETVLFLLGDELFFKSWHDVVGLVRAET
jgi:hypothetical protein